MLLKLSSVKMAAILSRGDKLNPGPHTKVIHASWQMNMGSCAISLMRLLQRVISVGCRKKSSQTREKNPALAFSMEGNIHCDTKKQVSLKKDPTTAGGCGEKRHGQILCKDNWYLHCV